MNRCGGLMGEHISGARAICRAILVSCVCKIQYARACLAVGLPVHLMVTRHGQWHRRDTEETAKPRKRDKETGFEEVERRSRRRKGR